MNVIYATLQLADYIRRMKVVFFAVALITVVNAASASASWITDTVDNTVGMDVGYDTSIAVDGSGKLHISYYDFTNGALKYATNATGVWVSETVDGSGNVGGFTSIAIDSNDKVHISYYSYYNGINGDLKYATGSAGSWAAIETLDHTDGEDVGYDTSIAIDSNNKVHISYLDFTNSNLKYATNATGIWVPETVDNSGSVGGFTSIATDSNNKLHISYYDVTGTLKYATNATGAWVPETVDNSGTVGGYTSIAIDSNDKIHISYYSYYAGINGDLKYATGSAGSWAIETIDHTDGEDVGYETSIVIDSNNKVHISYLDFTNSNLKYATNATGIWVPETVDNSGTVGGYTSIAASEEVHISYYDYSNNALMYAHADTITPSILSTTPANNATEVGTNTAITATFSEDMDSATINTSTITLSGGVTGTVTYDSATRTATFTPSGNLAYNASYTATITTGVKDVAGNLIASSYSFSFSTLVDITPPTVTISSPVIGTTNNNTPTLTFSVSDGTVVVKVDGIIVNKVSGNSLDTLSDASHTVRVESTDLAGNTGFDEVIFTVDTAPPVPDVTPVITLDGAIPGITQSYSYSNISASWTDYSDSSAGLKEYMIAVGDTVGGANIMGWTSAGTSAFYVTGDIQSLFETYKTSNGEYFGKTFYFTIKAIDLAENETSLSTSFIYTPADTNSKAGGGDGRVNGFDLGMLGIAFGGTTGGVADINRDGNVNGLDLIILAANFGKVKP